MLRVGKVHSQDMDSTFCKNLESEVALMVLAKRRILMRPIMLSDADCSQRVTAVMIYLPVTLQLLWLQTIIASVK